MTNAHLHFGLFLVPAGGCGSRGKKSNKNFLFVQTYASFRSRGYL